MASRSKRRRYESEVVDGALVVRFSDPILEEENSSIIREKVFQLLEESGQKQLRLDLVDVKFLSSAALGALIALRQKVEGIDGKLSMCNVNSEIQDVLRATKLDKVLAVRPA